jgi:hypothetical protein
MNKKLLLASAIAAIVNPASAATWDSSGFSAVVHTDEGIESSSELTGVAISSAYVSLGTEYAVNDQVTFTYSTAKGTNVSWPASLSSVVAGTATNATGTVTSLEVEGATNKGATSVTLSIAGTTTAGQTGVVIGDQFTLTGDSTATLHRVTSLVTGTTGKINITPALSETTTVNDHLTFKKPMTVQFGLLSGDSTAATYRVTQLTTSNTTTVSALLASPEVNVSPAALTAADTTIAFSAATATGTAMDALATTYIAAKSGPQFVASTTTAFDGVVDVENTRTQFVDSTTPVNTAIAATKKADTFSYKIQETEGTDGVAVSGAVTALNAAETKGVLTIAGSWDFLDEATTTGVTLTQATDASHNYSTTTTQIGTVTATSDTLTVTMTGTGAASGVTQQGTTASHSLDIVSTQTAAVIPVATYSPVFTLSYDPSVVGVDKTKAFTIASAGSWSLNGASITAYGVPMGSTVSRFLWLNNSGTTDGAVTASLTTGGVRYPTTGEYSLGTAAGQTNTEVGTALATAMSNAGVTLADSSRANITFVVPVKAAGVTLSAAYKHIADADRLTIETSDTTDGTDK